MTLSFTIPTGLKRCLEKLAEKEHRSLSNYVTLILIKHVEKLDIDWQTEDEKQFK